MSESKKNETLTKAEEAVETFSAILGLSTKITGAVADNLEKNIDNVKSIKASVKKLKDD